MANSLGARGAGADRSSGLRELMASLMKTSPRWYWTVRALMNSRAPICGIRQAVAGLPGDLGLLGGQLLAGPGGTPAGGLASRDSSSSALPVGWRRRGRLRLRLADRWPWTPGTGPAIERL